MNLFPILFFYFDMQDSSNHHTVGLGVWIPADRNSLPTKKEAEASFPLLVITDYSATASAFSAFGAFAFGAGAGFSSLTTGAVTTADGAPSPTIRFSSVV